MSIGLVLYSQLSPVNASPVPVWYLQNLLGGWRVLAGVFFWDRHCQGVLGIPTQPGYGALGSSSGSRLPWALREHHEANMSWVLEGSGRGAEGRQVLLLCRGPTVPVSPPAQPSRLILPLSSSRAPTGSRALGPRTKQECQVRNAVRGKGPRRTGGELGGRTWEGVPPFLSSVTTQSLGTQGASPALAGE